jgi:(E)-4-hydroxy-3-methylbut-2-enyl-diphosphate synthase
MRRQKRKIKAGSVFIGGGAPVSVQSMTKTLTNDIGRTASQINRLEASGCEIVRAAVPDMESAKAIGEIKKEIRIPLIADIHFNYKLAVASAEAGADGIRLNPGNIFRREEIEKVAGICLDKNIPIRVGVNSGSLKPEHTPENAAEVMAEEALSYCAGLEKLRFKDIIVSLKASDVQTTISAYRAVAARSDYPLHLGVTAAGTFKSGAVKSAVCMGILLGEGIGDTIRVSLTGDPAEEVKTGFEILSSLGLRSKKGPDIISCPTCGRCRVDLVSIAEETEKSIDKLNLAEKLSGIKIAIMGCAVNGPGEAGEADIGIACGLKSAAFFKKGGMEKKVAEKDAVRTLINELKIMAGDK